MVSNTNNRISMQSSKYRTNRVTRRMSGRNSAICFTSMILCELFMMRNRIRARDRAV